MIGAFQMSGCWPVNPNVFTEVDYAPSIVISTSSTHIPSSYPGIPTQSEDHDNSDSDSDSDKTSDSNCSDASDEQEQHCQHNTNSQNHLLSQSIWPTALPPTTDHPMPPFTTILTSFIPVCSGTRSKSHPG